MFCFVQFVAWRVWNTSFVSPRGPTLAFYASVRVTTGEDSGNIRDITGISPSCTKNSLRPFILQTKPPTFAGCRFVHTRQNKLYLTSVRQDERVLALAVSFLRRNKSPSTTQRHSCSFCLAAPFSFSDCADVKTCLTAAAGRNPELFYRQKVRHHWRRYDNYLWYLGPKKTKTCFNVSLMTEVL